MIRNCPIRPVSVTGMGVLVLCLANSLNALQPGATPAAPSRPTTAAGNEFLPAHLRVPATGCDTLVLCPRALSQSLVPWLEYRQRQGYRIHVLQPARDAFRIKQQIRDVARQTTLKYILLIGDTPDYAGHNREVATATDYIAARVVSKFGSEPEIASDNVFADLDDDGLPDVAIGRLPADSAEQLSLLTAKIMGYEAARLGPWQRRINLVAGTGGFGEVSDNVIEKTSRGMISDLIPPAYSVSLTWANWSSAFCPDPREFADTTVARLNEGCLFWVYMGHGHPHRLDYVRTPVGGYPMFSQRDVQRVHCRDGLPVALMLACYTGAFDLPNDCLAEQLVLQPGGPVAAVCSSRVSMPYGMSVLSLGLIEEYFTGQRQTLGEMLLEAKRQLARPAEKLQPQRIMDGEMISQNPHQKYRETIRVLGETLGPAGNRLSDEAREHVHLFHLLGDPLLRMKRPESMEITVQQDPDLPQRLMVQGRVPQAGELLVELSYARDRFQARPPRRGEFRSDATSLAGYQKVYADANQRTVTQRVVSVDGGEFCTELELPAWARGRCVVRGFLTSGPERFALGASPIKLKRR